MQYIGDAKSGRLVGADQCVEFYSVTPVEFLFLFLFLSLYSRGNCGLMSTPRREPCV